MRSTSTPRRIDASTIDDRVIFRRVSVFIWLIAAPVTALMAVGGTSLRPGSTWFVLVTSLFVGLSGVAVKLVPLHHALVVDMLCRVVTISMITVTLLLSVEPEHLAWFTVLCLPTLILPATFYPTRLFAVVLTMTCAQVITVLWAADGPVDVKTRTFGAFVLSAALVCSIIRFLAQQRRKTIEELERLAHTDGLTELPNRRAFMAASAAALDAAKGDGRPCAMVILDIDRFKTVNDTYGHEVGDRVLVATGRVLDAAAPATDLVARLGGEEFAILYVGKTADDAVAECMAIASRLRRIEPVAVTCSYGVAQSADDDTIGNMLLRADTALYTAKSGGRDQAVTAA